MKNKILHISFCVKKISSTLRWGKSFLFICISANLIFFIGGCKDEEDLGLKILPPGDQLFTAFSDTTSVNTLTLLEDSLRTDELSLQLVGSDKDPVFGLTTASVYTQVNLEGTPAFGTSPTADSLVLILDYSGYYGDTLASQTINVFRLNEDMSYDSTYYSTKIFAFDSSNTLGSLTFSPRPNTNIVIATDTLFAQVRIPLSLVLADSILNLKGQDALTSNDKWLSYFKGLYIKATDASSQGVISYFNFFNSKLTLYFHDSTTAKSYNFSLTGARTNRFYHDFTGTPVALQLNDSTNGDSLNYVQATCGVKMKISFPFLKHFLDSGSILINKAELKINAVSATYPYGLPSKMLLVTKNETGESIFPLDFYESAGFFGGDLNSTSDGYSFNIARQLQRYLDGSVSNADFYLLISGSGIEANRAIIRSGSNANSKMKLSIYYSKLN